MKRSLMDILGDVLRACASPSTARAYERIIRDYLAYLDEIKSTPHLGPEAITRHSIIAYLRRRSSTAGAATMNQDLAAIRRYVQELREGGLVEETTLASIARIRAKPIRGQRLGKWLTQEQAGALLHAPDTTTMIGQRDRIMLGMLIEAGLRRDEAANLRAGQLQKVDDKWAFRNVVGKGNRTRTVFIRESLARRIQEWISCAKISEDECILCATVGGSRSASTCMSDVAIWKRVDRCAKAAGLPKIAPHDLRRTFAHLARVNGATLESIRAALGHSDLKTTQRYLGLGIVDVESACDALPDFDADNDNSERNT